MESKSLFSIGECMIEFRQENDGQFMRSFGGDSLSTAILFQRLAGRAVYATQIGDDFFGAWLKASIESEGVLLADSTLIDREKNAVYFIQNTKDGERQFQYYRANSAASHMSFKKCFEAQIESSDLLFSSGISLALSDSVFDCVLRAFKRGRQFQKTNAFDLNYRALLWPQKSPKAVFDKILPYVDILFVSAADLEGLELRSPNDLIEKLEVPLVIYRNGGQPGFVYDRGNQSRFEFEAQHPRSVVDTTGAGDVFNGAFLAGYALGKTTREALDWATRAAKLQIEKPGSTAAIPTKEMVVFPQ